MCSFPTFFTKEWNFEAKKKLNSNSQSPTCTYLVFIPLKSCKDPIKKISLLSNQLYIVELTHHTVLAVLSIRHLPENFPLVIPLLSFRINWLQTEFSVSNFRRWSLNNFVFDKNPSTDHFVIKIFYLLTCKPAPWVSHKKSSEMTYMVTVYQNLSQFAVGTSNLFFFFLGWKCLKCILKYMIGLTIKLLSKLVYKGKSRLKEL